MRRPVDYDDEGFTSYLHETIHPQVNDLGGHGGGNISGAFAQRLRQVGRLSDESRPLQVTAIEPGDFGVATSGQELMARLPVEADVWYLIVPENILPDWKAPDVVKDQDIARLKDSMPEALRAVSPMRTAREPGQAHEMAHSYEYAVKAMHFWVRRISMPLDLASEYPNETRDQSQVRVVLGIPVGPLGVMESVSLVSETMKGEDRPWELQPGGGFFPPYHGKANILPGIKLVESGYVKRSDDTQLLAAPLRNVVPAHSILRYYVFDLDGKWPRPGEFIGVLCRPISWWAWWWQETKPFLYAGNFFETEFLTSGVVLEVFKQVEDEAGDVALAPRADGDAQGDLPDIYKLRVKLDHVYVLATDWKRYDVGDTVAVLKVSNDVMKVPFDHTRLKDPEIRKEDPATRDRYHEEFADGLVPIYSRWRIVPLDFYK